jgi:hypothetical protein
LLLRVEQRALVGERGGGDFVGGEVLARLSASTSRPRAISVA